MHPTGFILDDKNGPVVRFLQDQPLAYGASVKGRDAGESGFFWKQSEWLANIGFLTPKQVAVCLKGIEERNWIEPPRFDPFVTLAPARKPGDPDRFIVNICPGRRPTKERIEAYQAEAKAAGRKIEWTIGGIADFTLDLYDPMLQANVKRGRKSRYVTCLSVMLARAEAAGALVAEPSDTGAG
ncbi:hypothetical protein FIU28_17455 [Tardiphaga sp. vice154]|uniref:hypothetical protein n=1 Tax=Tardiphaga sp. vice154 TaxID=2592814 RepID=UPI0011630064|nr:hypothetical protein [Tardiphaga sp. vice154]QDM22739.1 hypothetical protein FIU28_17455 [Tardiphaga sp. vice154]